MGSKRCLSPRGSYGRLQFFILAFRNSANNAWIMWFAAVLVKCRLSFPYVRNKNSPWKAEAEICAKFPCRCHSFNLTWGCLIKVDHHLILGGFCYSNAKVMLRTFCYWIIGAGHEFGHFSPLNLSKLKQINLLSPWLLVSMVLFPASICWTW